MVQSESKCRSVNDVFGAIILRPYSSHVDIMTGVVIVSLTKTL